MKGLTLLLLSVMKHRESCCGRISVVPISSASVTCFRDVRYDCGAAVSVFFLLPWKAKVHLWKGEGKWLVLTAAAVRTKPWFAEGGGKSSSPELGCSWGSCGFGAGWGMGCRVELSCRMSSKLVVKGGASLWWQPGRIDLWGTLVNFLTPVKFKIPLETTLFKNLLFI